MSSPSRVSPSPSFRWRRRWSSAPAYTRRGAGGAHINAVGRVIELYRKGDTKGGDRLKNELSDSVERKLSEWIAIHFGVVGFDRIAAFKRDNPDWPTLAALGRRAEEALLAGRAPAAVQAFFAERPPTSPEGKIVLALAAKSAGASSEQRHSSATLGATTRSEANSSARS